MWLSCVEIDNRLIPMGSIIDIKDTYENDKWELYITLAVLFRRVYF